MNWWNPKIKDEKNNSANKTNKLSRTGTNNTNNNNNLRKSYQNLNININNNLITKSKANSKPKNKKSLSHYGTKADLGVKAKKNNDIKEKEERIKSLENEIKLKEIEEMRLTKGKIKESGMFDNLKESEVFDIFGWYE